MIGFSEKERKKRKKEKVFVRLKFANCLVGLFRCLVSERMRMRTTKLVTRLRPASI